jgi:hypothetical protein
MIKLGPTKNKVSSANNRCEMSTTQECLDPTENPKRRPPLTMAESILLKASITITKRNGDKGSPYLKPRELLKKLDGLPFTKTEKRTEEIQRYPRASFLLEIKPPQ